MGRHKMELRIKINTRPIGKPTSVDSEIKVSGQMAIQMDRYGT